MFKDRILQATALQPQTLPAAPGAAPGRTSVTDVFRGFKAQRSILGDQLRSLENKRSEFIQSLQTPNLAAADRAGLEKRVVDIDARISDMDKQIAVADADVARSAAVPGTTVEAPSPPRSGPPDEFYALSALFIIVTLLPLSIAFARRIWRRSAAVTVKLTKGLDERMNSLEQAVEAVAVEVERIGEGQRFVTQLLADNSAHALGDPVTLQQPQRLPEARR